MPVSALGSLDDLTPEERSRILLEAVTEYAIYTMDINGFITTWNAGAQKLKGYAPAEIIGQHFSRLFTAEDRTAGRPGRILAEAIAQGRSENEGWRVRKDGSRVWTLAVVEPIRNAAGKVVGFVKITRDVTQRREAELALQESERRFRLLVDGAIDYAMYLLDPSGVITSWNKGGERIKGYTADEIIGQHFSRFFTKEDRAAGLPARALESAARTGRFETEGWRMRKDGGRFWANVVVDAIRDESGELIGFAKITRDVTERVQAQEALRETERLFTLLVKGVTDYALYMLDPNGIVTNWNAGAERIKGYAADEIIGQHFSRFYTEEARSAGAPARALHIAAQEGRFEAESWRVRKDGTLFWASVVIDAIRDERGKLIGFAKITRDITERRQAQEALQHTQAQLAQAQKMEALGQLTGGVAHDFNNLLMIVSGQMRTLNKLLGDSDRGRRAAAAIELAVKRGESLTRQLLTFSRRQDLNPTVTNLSERVEALRALLSSSVAGAARLGVTILPEVWPIEIDVSEFDLALVNLVANARDAMPGGGMITVTAENVTLRAGEVPDLAGDYVAVTVADTGQGIPEDILPKVFDPFFTTKATGKGTGLGLSQVHGFAHQSGGSVNISSVIGSGTRVTMYLPRSLGETPAPAPAVEHAEPTLGGAALMVEDNPEVAQAARTLLEDLGYRVSVAGDPQGALEALAGGAFDLVVTDIVMPGSMNGLELARALRQRYPHLPVVLTTGYSRAAEEAAGDFVVLRKPYHVTELSRGIGNAIARARSQDGDSNLVDFPAARRGRGTSPRKG